MIMAKVIPVSERIKKAHALIEKARQIPLPDEHGWMDLSYTANVKDTLRQARAHSARESRAQALAHKDRVKKLRSGK